MLLLLFTLGLAEEDEEEEEAAALSLFLPSLPSGRQILKRWILLIESSLINLMRKMKLKSEMITAAKN